MISQLLRWRKENSGRYGWTMDAGQRGHRAVVSHDRKLFRIIISVHILVPFGPNRSFFIYDCLVSLKRPTKYELHRGPSSKFINQIAFCYLSIRPTVYFNGQAHSHLLAKCRIHNSPI